MDSGGCTSNSRLHHGHKPYNSCQPPERRGLITQQMVPHACCPWARPKLRANLSLFWAWRNRPIIALCKMSFVYNGYHIYIYIYIYIYLYIYDVHCTFGCISVIIHIPDNLQKLTIIILEYANLLSTSWQASSVLCFNILDTQRKFCHWAMWVMD